MHVTQFVKSIPDAVWQRRPEPDMFSELEEASLAYFHGGAQEILARCAEILSASSPEQFAEELEKVARTGEHLNGLDMMIAGVSSRVHKSKSKSESEENWPVVHAAVAGALGGPDAATVFAEGLFLLHQRRMWSSAAAERGQSGHDTATPRAPDPVIWGELFKVDKGDACFAAVLSLLVSGKSCPDWMGLLLADGFREGQTAGVRVFASLFGSEADDALRQCKVERIDWVDRWQKAQRVDAGISQLTKGWEDRSKTHSPFGDLSDNEKDYPDDDSDEWEIVGGAA